MKIIDLQKKLKLQKSDSHWLVRIMKIIMLSFLLLPLSAKFGEQQSLPKFR